jgi:ring-1,2-phenylacetyl-CoA epoxidase subunit PaaD
MVTTVIGSSAAPRGARAQPSLDALWAALADVADPEIPVLSIVDLGIVRAVEHDADDPRTVLVRVTPTYSGCPATELIIAGIRDALAAAGVEKTRLEIALAPAWTTDWISAQGRRKLAEYGIAPPLGDAPFASSRVDVAGISPLRRVVAAIACPRCGSRATRLVSQFGSTACKALMRCDDCLEPFDYFKPH